MDTVYVKFFRMPKKQEAQGNSCLGFLTWDVRERLGSQDFGEVGTDSAVIGTVELHHVFLDTSLADD